ncbi:MAG: hypothetical protein K1X79_07990 [Oligoflexia bacterium]|nr:hypothetical protein [Oligoflexia bacterium]
MGLAILEYILELVSGCTLLNLVLVLMKNMLYIVTPIFCLTCLFAVPALSEEIYDPAASKDAQIDPLAVCFCIQVSVPMAEGGNAWYYDLDSTPSKIYLCDRLVEPLADPSEGAVDILIGCSPR